MNELTAALEFLFMLVVPLALAAVAVAIIGFLAISFVKAGFAFYRPQNQKGLLSLEVRHLLRPLHQIPPYTTKRSQTSGMGLYNRQTMSASAAASFESSRRGPWPTRRIYP